MTLSKSRRFARFSILCACVAVAGLVSAQPAMTKSKSKSKTKTYYCGDLSNKRTPKGLKGGYITSIKVVGRYSKKSSACRSGRSLVLNYYKCRARKKSIKASCNGRTINGLKCRDSRPKDSQTDTEINARVTCKKGSKKIYHNYQQNLS